MNFDPPSEADWPAIRALADASAPSKITDNQTWVENRRSFAGRKHHVVAREASAEVVGFGAAEDAGGRWRIFIVVQPPSLDSVGDALFRSLEASLREERVDSLWAREEPVDAGLIAFLKARGFQEAQPETLPSGQVVVLLTKVAV